MIAGCPRSGSTILGKILSLSPRAGYIEEAFNPETGIEGTSQMFVIPDTQPAQQSLYDKIAAELGQGTAQYKQSVFRPQKLGAGRWIFYKLFTNRYQFRYRLDTLNPFITTYISKDPTASLAAEYLHRRHNFKVILTVRHPCGVVVSHNRLRWGSPIAQLLARPEIRTYIGEEALSLDLKKLSPNEKLAWYWRVINEVLYEQAKRNPDIVVIEHEEFSLRPLEVTKVLYKKAGLRYTKRIDQKVRVLTGAGNPTDPRSDRAHTLRRNSRDNIDRWRKHLSKADIAAIERIAMPTYKKIQSLPNLVKISDANESLDR